MKQKKLLVIDGQGGRMGAALVSQCKAAGLPVQIIAVGANSAATTSWSRHKIFSQKAVTFFPFGRLIDMG